MFKTNDLAECSLREILFTVSAVLDLGEGVHLIGYIDQQGDTRWIREELCKKVS